MVNSKKPVSYRVNGSACQQGYQDLLACDSIVYTPAGVPVVGAVVVAGGDCPQEVVVVPSLAPAAATFDREFQVMCAPDGTRVMVRDVSSSAAAPGTVPVLEFYTLAGGAWAGDPATLSTCDVDDDVLEITPLQGCLNGVEIQGIALVTDSMPPTVIGELWRGPLGVWGVLPAGATVGACAAAGAPLAGSSKYASYVVQQVDEATAGTTYVRKQGADPADTWLIQRVVESGTDTTITFAGVRNNAAVLTAAAAWAARVSLVYGEINEA